MEGHTEVQTDRHGATIAQSDIPERINDTSEKEDLENFDISQWFPYAFLLDFFGGMASASIVLETLGIDRLATFTWETDQACIDIAQRHFPDIQHRGDLRMDNMIEIAAEIERLTNEHVRVAAAGKKYIPPVIITIAAPCPDFSPMKGPDAPGREGELGRLFDDCCDQVDILEDNISNRIVILAENVHVESGRSALRQTPEM